jgi:hypothetical protein
MRLVSWEAGLDAKINLVTLAGLGTGVASSTKVGIAFGVGVGTEGPPGTCEDAAVEVGAEMKGCSGLGAVVGVAGAAVPQASPARATNRSIARICETYFQQLLLMLSPLC